MTDAKATTDWQGLEVAITGRLASMPRAEAVRRLERAGARPVVLPTASTALLVVGRGGPPLGEDGRLTASLREARHLQGRGAALEIVPEEVFLQRLGLHDRQADLHRLYTIAHLGRILGVPASRVRRWVHAGLITPARTVGRLLFFGFAEVSAARTLLNLTRSGVTPARLRRSLGQLSDWLDDGGRSLAQLELLERGRTLVVRMPDGRLAEPSGQLVFGFGDNQAGPTHEPPLVLPLGGATEHALDPARDPGAASGARATRSLDIDAWFDAALRAEAEDRLDDALGAYAHAELLGGEQPDLCFNRGNVLFALGRADAAEASFRRAIALDPVYAEAWNNLGVVLGDLGRIDQAVDAYRRALDAAPGYADAHYNLAETLAGQGDRAGACEHWRHYLEQDPHGLSAREVRARLEGAEE